FSHLTVRKPFLVSAWKRIRRRFLSLIRAQAWCIDFYENKLTDIEKNCVISTVKNDPEYQNASATFGAVNNILNEDKIFFLSAEEAESAAYGFASPDDRKALYNGLQKNWWLRSPSIHTESVTGSTWGGLF